MSARLPQSSAITVLSPGFRRLLIERGVPDEKVHVVYNWADEEAFRPRERDLALARELGLAGRFSVMSPGISARLQRLDARDPCREADSGYVSDPGVIAGHGQTEPELRRLASAVRCLNVRFLGRRQPS